jgi:hypothetical protein
MSNMVAPLNDHWRVVCDGTQWILQRFHENDGWRARACCRTRQALERCLEIHVDSDIDPATLAILSELPAQPSEAVTSVVAQLDAETIVDPVAQSEAAASSMVAQLSPHWRVLVASDGKQWVLQRLHALDALSNEEDWRARSHCRTRYALENCVKLYVTGAVDPAALAILAALPGHIDWQRGK